MPRSIKVVMVTVLLAGLGILALTNKSLRREPVKSGIVSFKHGDLKIQGSGTNLTYVFQRKTSTIGGIIQTSVSFGPGDDWKPTEGAAIETDTATQTVWLFDGKNDVSGFIVTHDATHWIGPGTQQIPDAFLKKLPEGVRERVSIAPTNALPKFLRPENI